MAHSKTIKYPSAPKRRTINQFHGTEIVDHYKWMENGGNEELHNWLSAQDKLLSDYLIDNEDTELDLSILDNAPPRIPSQLPISRGKHEFVIAPSRNDDLVIYVREDGPRKIIFDPKSTLEYASYRIFPDFFFVSPKGHYIAFALIKPGSDRSIIAILDVRRGKLLKDTIQDSLNPIISWLPDESGYYYNITKYGCDAATQPGIYLHILGQDPKLDILSYDYSDGDGHASLPYVSENGHYLIVKTLNFVTQKAGLFFRPLCGNVPFATLFADLETTVNIVGMDEDTLFIETTLSAPNGRIMAIDLRNPLRENWSEVIPECNLPLARSTHSTTSRLTALAGDHLFITYLDNAYHKIHEINLKGEVQQILEFPEDFITILQVEAASATSIDIAFESFFTPYERHRYNADNHELTLYERVESGIDIQGFGVEQRTYTSKDGTLIPIYIFLREKHPPRPLPLILHGYGGWGVSSTPGYRPDMIAWLSQGGGYAIPNIRGGGEFGEAWHEQGKKLNKQNVFDDFCAAAEYLIDQRITSPDNLAIHGLSNGGLLVTACSNQRPELFSAVIAEVPLIDVVHQMETPVGPAVAAELGDPTSDKTTFEYMLSYSPLQNIEPTPDRPNILLLPAENDERAQPAWVYKYLAALQDTAMPGQVALMKLVVGEGHVGWPWRVEKEMIKLQLKFVHHSLMLFHT